MKISTVTTGIEAWATPALHALLVGAAVLIGYRLLLVLMRRFSDSRAKPRIFLNAAAFPLGSFLVLIGINTALGSSDNPPFLPEVQHLLKLLVILTATWMAVNVVSAVGELIVHMNPAYEDKWLHARKLETQTRFLVRGSSILIVIIGLGIALMTFDSVRQVGTSLLASAGIGGIILGFAARPVLGNLLAGVQIALTQPFRIDDVLYIDGEWCWVEEVTATYVVLRVWDLRRVVVPLDWFITNKFENWSRHSTELMGTVFLWLDYAMPIEPLREAFLEMLQNSPDWNGNTQDVLVTNASDRAMEVRFLMSARSSRALWSLRCHIREGMIAFVRDHYPEHLPRLRASISDRSGNNDPIDRG
ncbi:MAG: mechanosensitive ion channel family protein [Pseudomonadota bacterium]